jgi:uncharacterized membrane protein
MILAVAFVAFEIPPYFTGDPAQSRIQPAPQLAAYFPVLTAHVILGCSALLAGCLQVWPWLRARHPRMHRITGRVYVGLCIVAGLLALYLATNTPYGPVARASSTVLATLWIATSLAGLFAARRKDFAAHRRWMIRSFVLACSIATNRVWVVVLVITLTPSFPSNNLALLITTAGLSSWLGWTLPLLAAQLWLDRDYRRRAVDLDRTPAPTVADHDGNPDHRSEQGSRA